MIKCTFPDCTATTTAPFSNGWSYLSGWAGLQEGYYCPTHASAAVEELEMGDCEWCGVEPATERAYDVRLCHECAVADDEEWVARGPRAEQ
jgi:hypothetical protein